MNGVKLINLETAAEVNDGDIGEWLLVLVLISLPVKLVFRLKLVSKQWLSIISHPSFSRAYVRRSSSFPQLNNWAFIFRNMRINNGSNISNEQLVNMYSCELEIPGLYTLPFPCSQQPGETKYKIFGVGNGLVLYGPMKLLFKSGNRLASYSICNPATGKSIALPPQSSHSNVMTEQITGFFTRVERNILTSYRVVCLHLAGESKVINLDVLISQTSKWTEFNVRIGHVVEFESYIRPPAVPNRVMHWTTREHGLLSYDPYRALDCLCFVPLPEDRNPRFNDGRSVPNICDVYQGHLRYFEAFLKDASPVGCIRVWMLDEYKSGVWSLLHGVNFADISCDGIFSRQGLVPTHLSFHPFDDNIVYLGYHTVLLAYNFKNRKLEACGGSRGAIVSNRMVKGWNGTAWWWTLLFVIPPWPISITCPEI